LKSSSAKVQEQAENDVFVAAAAAAATLRQRRAISWQ
jgi:hypothetical protein